MISLNEYALARIMGNAVRKPPISRHGPHMAGGSSKITADSVPKSLMVAKISAGLRIRCGSRWKVKRNRESALVQT